MRLCWLDDDAGSVLEIAHTVFCTLWRDLDCLALDVKFFGDGYKTVSAEQDASNEDIQQMETRLKNMFREVCTAQDKINWESLGTTYDAKIAHMPIRCQNLRHLMSAGGELGEFLQQWKDIGTLTPDAIQALCQNEEGIQAFVEGLEIEAGILALDICLQKDDVDRWAQGVPTLSMAIYHHLKGRFRCYVYSRMQYREEWRRKWEETYRKLFREEPPKIYSRFKLCENVHSEDYETLFELCKKERSEVSNA